jgi:hypothetical protein
LLDFALELSLKKTPLLSMILCQESLLKSCQIGSRAVYCDELIWT